MKRLVPVLLLCLPLLFSCSDGGGTADDGKPNGRVDAGGYDGGGTPDTAVEAEPERGPDMRIGNDVAPEKIVGGGTGGGTID